MDGALNRIRCGPCFPFHFRMLELYRIRDRRPCNRGSFRLLKNI